MNERSRASSATSIKTTPANSPPGPRFPHRKTPEENGDANTVAMAEALEIGTKVRFADSGEVGIVVWTWHDEFLDTQDCYVAFVGTEFPTGKPLEPPYVLRYLASSLEVVER